jgi:hypothetical protein
MFWVWILAGIGCRGFILLCATVVLDGKPDAEHQADQAAANMAETLGGKSRGLSKRSTCRYRALSMR